MIQKILNKILDKNNKLSSARINSLTDEDKNIILNLNPLLKSDSLPEHLYWIVNGLYEYPKKCENGNCENKITQFHSFSKGYVQKFCCLSCMQKCPTTINKKKETILRKYGVNSIWQVDSIVSKRKILVLNGMVLGTH